MQIIELSKKLDSALDNMDTATYSVVNNVQGGYLTVEEALKQVSEAHYDDVKDAGKLWSLIEELDEVQSEAFNQWLDDEMDEEDLKDIL